MDILGQRPTSRHCNCFLSRIQEEKKDGVVPVDPVFRPYPGPYERHAMYIERRRAPVLLFVPLDISDFAEYQDSVSFFRVHNSTKNVDLLFFPFGQSIHHDIAAVERSPIP